MPAVAQTVDRHDLIAALANRIAAIERPHPVRVAFTGITAAGKTILADELQSAIAALGRPVHRCEFDDFHPKGYKYRSMREEWTGDLYWREGYDYAAFRRFVLDPLGPGGDRNCRLALFSSYHDEFLPETWTAIEPNAVVLVDGGLLLHPLLRDAWDFVAWLEVPEETANARAVVRDAAWAADVTSIERRYRAYHVPAHRLHIASGARERADVTIENSDPMHPVVEWGGEDTSDSATL